MTTAFIRYPAVPIRVATFASLPPSANNGDLAEALDTNVIYAWNQTSQTWVVVGGPGAGSGVTTVGTIDSQSKSANAAVISGVNIYMQTAEATFPGVVSTGTQTFAGLKTFTSPVLGPDGAAANVAFGFDSDVDTGMIRSANNVLGFVAGGTELFKIQPGGQVQIVGSGIASVPALALASDIDTGVYWNGANGLFLSTAGTQAIGISSSQLVTLASLAVTGATTLSTSLTGIAHLTAGVVSASAIVNADVSAAAAIDFSKLATLASANILVGSAGNVATSVVVTGDVTISNAGVTAIGSGVIVNADVNASAAIDGTKISPNFGSQAVVTTGTLASGAATFTGVTDIINGAISLTLGGDNAASQRTNNTNKIVRIANAHYQNAEEPFTLMVGASATATNTLAIGGGSSTTNTATEIDFYTAANNTTLTGTVVGVISSAGLWTIGANATTQQHAINGATQASGADIMTMTNGPGGTAGNPDLFIKITYNGTTYVIPAWTPT